MNVFRPTVGLALVLTLSAGVACGSDSTEPEPGDPVLSSVSGTGQSAVAGEAVADPLVVRVTRDGQPVSDRAVTWTVTAGGGSVSPTSSSTNAGGEASTVWTLGATAGDPQTVEASATGVDGTVQFMASAEEDTPAPMEAGVSVGDNFFDPDAVTIATGGEVTWTWAGSVGHNVTFSSGSNSATQTSGTFSRTFPTAGQFDYLCTIHGSSMSGTVMVVDPS